MKIRSLIAAAGVAAASVALAAPAGAQTYQPSPGCASSSTSPIACTEVAGVQVNRSSGLARTGVETATIVIAGTTLVVGGAGLVMSTRRRRAETVPVRV